MLSLANLILHYNVFSLWNLWMFLLGKLWNLDTFRDNFRSAKNCSRKVYPQNCSRFEDLHFSQQVSLNRLLQVPPLKYGKNTIFQRLPELLPTAWMYTFFFVKLFIITVTVVCYCISAIIKIPWEVLNSNRKGDWMIKIEIALLDFIEPKQMFENKSDQVDTRIWVLFRGNSQSVSNFADQIYSKSVLLDFKETQVIFKWATEMKYVGQDAIWHFLEIANRALFQWFVRGILLTLWDKSLFRRI